MIRRDQKKLAKYIKLLLSEVCITQYKPLVYDFKIRKVKDTNRNFVPRKGIWKLIKGSIESDFFMLRSSKRAVRLMRLWKLIKKFFK